MDVPLEGLKSKTKVITRKRDAGLKKVAMPIKEVTDFLKKYTTAKIVVVIDTHCLDNGQFVWTGNSPKEYEACPLSEESICLPFTTIAADPCTDLAGLHLRRGQSVPLGFTQQSKAQSQKHYPESCLWAICDCRFFM